MFKKLMGAFTALIFIGVLITGLLSIEIAKTYYFESVEDKLITSAKLMQNRLVEESFTYPIDFEHICSQYSEIIGERVTIIGSKGDVLGDSDADAGQMDNHSERPEVIQALKDGFGKSIRRSEVLGKDMLYIALPLKDGASTGGVIRVALPLDDVGIIQKRIWYYVFGAIFLGITAALVLGYRYLSMVTAPIAEMTDMASTIAGGRFDRRVRVRGNDEIGSLAAAFNHMAERMSRLVEELIDGKSEIEAILSSSVNGVVAVDDAGRAMFINPIAKRMLNIRNKDIIGLQLLDIVRNNEVSDILKNLIGVKREQTVEFELTQPQQKVIRLISTPIRAMKKHGRTIGTLLIIYDVTKVKRLEKMRTEFVTNVTHELKTPLTTIMGFVETLKQGAIDDPEIRGRFIDIIGTEAKRLERLIEDILLLSEIESGKKPSMLQQPLDVRRVIEEEVLPMFLQQAGRKGISLRTYFGDHLTTLLMDRDRFKQMLINLVDNAVKYTGDGGVVTISVNRNGPDMVLEVKDTGIGIPVEHQGRIFERFYRVDSGRSRKEGGTGLGLAIVKHIVLSTNGSVEVDSKPGVGTVFRIRIPFQGEE